MSRRDQESGASGGSTDSVTWHALTADTVLDRLRSTRAGLSSEEAARRRAEVGPNRLPESRGRSPVKRLLSQFNNLLIVVLLVAATLSALMDHWVDAVVILGVVLVNAVIGFVQEGRAEEALNAIRGMLAPKASVKRDGKRVQIPAEDLVPGDIVLLEPGDRVPADVRVLQGRGLHTHEAVLTGESVAVEKSAEVVPEDAALGDRGSIAHSGTLVVSGQGEGVVVTTGPATEIGRISGMLAGVQELTTPLLQQMSVFARRLTAVIGVVVAAVFLYGWGLQGQPGAEMFMIVVGLAVATIPEGLPTILTVTLAIGVQRMAGRNAIIRRLPAVETLGALSIICSDKTGTLTRNEMMVASVATADDIFSVTGNGYDPHGDFRRDERPVDPDTEPALMELLRAGCLCNDAALQHREDIWSVNGDPMEGALLVAAMKAGLDPVTEGERLHRVDVIPFDSEHRFMATLHHDHAGGAPVFLKGAPERVLEMCTFQRRDGETVALDIAPWRARIQELAGRGQRVLAAATFHPADEPDRLHFSDVEGELELLGLFGLIDPPRDEAIAAVQDCRAAGIRVKMITGDHGTTAGAIARQLGLENPDDVVTGPDLDALDDAALRERAPAVDVFARTSPAHKLRLVEALQYRGDVVAMTGDGVNDAPALKRADVGVAMGRGGTEAARESAEMVLADDNFASIAAAVREGRTVYDNLKKAILFLLPVNGGEAISILLAVLAGLTLPITPLQILWVNMVSSVALAMALAFEPTEPDAMRRPPRRRDEPILSLLVVWRVAFVSALFALGIFGIFAWTRSQGADLEQARTYAVNTLVVMEIFYLFNVRYLAGRSLTLRGILGTRAVLIALAAVVVLQLMFTYAPFMSHFFDTRPVEFVHGVEILAIGIVLFAILELEKAVRRHWAPRAGEA
ncbi:cation-translocating P-type ATPase [Halofilum ochraceum]|uniref:cation-translocating P-type ATPase n=1 Tax=Halofilum ochraceum TaxID=1611323 RepID=UPI00082C00F0|nr:HAD-IC family P-type ATPase [Halofilum ochraceum]